MCDDANTLEEPNEDAFVASQATQRAGIRGAVGGAE